MMYTVYGKHETSPKTFIRIEAESHVDAESEALRRGWTVERVETFVPPQPAPSAAALDAGIPEYEGLWMMALLLRLFGVAIAVAAGYALLTDVGATIGVPTYIVAIVLFLVAFEVYVSGEAVGAFRHLVQNSWLWRRTQK